MPRENPEAKARRYLGEGRLIVTRVDHRTIEATCRGDGHTYRLGRDHCGWHCTCPAKTRCAHLVALGLVCSID
jgi:hypothetical protein